jgi:hypothetical protein
MQPPQPLHLPAPAGLQAQVQVQVQVQAQPQQQQEADVPPQQPPACANADGSSSSSSSASSQRVLQQNSSSIPLAANMESSSSNKSGSRGGSCPGAEPSRMHTAVASVVRHPIAELLNQVLLLVGYFCVQAPSNQAMLLFGRSPNILQRLCSMPFQYFSIPELRAVAMPTLLSVCFGADRTCEVVAQHVSLEMLLQFVRQQLAHQQQEQPAGQEQQAQPQQQGSAGLIPPEVQLLLQRLVSLPCSVEGSSGSAGSSNSSCSGPFSLARRFPLAALKEAEVYLQKQLQAQQASAAAPAAAAEAACGQAAAVAAAAISTLAS